MFGFQTDGSVAKVAPELPTLFWKAVLLDHVQQFPGGRGKLTFLRSGYCPQILCFCLKSMLGILHYILPISQKTGCKKDGCVHHISFTACTSQMCVCQPEKMTSVTLSSPNNVLLPQIGFDLMKMVLSSTHKYSGPLGHLASQDRFVS